MEGKWLCYRGGHFDEGKMVTLQRWSVQCRENCHITEVVSNGGRMVMLHKSPD